MVVEHVLVSGTEHCDDGEHPLSGPRDQGLHGGASLQLDQVQPPSRGGAEADLTILGASPVPAWNKSGFMKNLLLVKFQILYRVNFKANNSLKAAVIQQNLVIGSPKSPKIHR